MVSSILSLHRGDYRGQRNLREAKCCKITPGKQIAKNQPTAQGHLKGKIALPFPSKRISLVIKTNMSIIL